MKLKNRAVAAIAGGALALSALGGAGGVALATAPDAHAAGVHRTYNSWEHKPKSAICLLFNICKTIQHWHYSPKYGRYMFHIDRY